jgi:hypothetical protein
MDPKTGEIFDKLDENPEVQKAIKKLQDKLNEAEKLVDIPDKDFMRVVNMNRHQRRKWAADQRKKKK